MEMKNRLALSPAEVAATLGVCRRTIENLFSAGELPRRKIGRRTVVLVSDLEIFLKRDHRAAVAAQPGEVSAL